MLCFFERLGFPGAFFVFLHASLHTKIDAVRILLHQIENPLNSVRVGTPGAFFIFLHACIASEQKTRHTPKSMPFGYCCTKSKILWAAFSWKSREQFLFLLFFTYFGRVIRIPSVLHNTGNLEYSSENSITRTSNRKIFTDCEPWESRPQFGIFFEKSKK